MTNTNLLKSKMIAKGHENFVESLASLLNISRSTASKKLNGQTNFGQSEISMVADYYDLSAEDIQKIFIEGG
jgi:hypothetical protein